MNEDKIPPCLAVPAAEHLRCSDELQRLCGALEGARLTAQERQAIDIGDGLRSEARVAEPAAEGLRACPRAETEVSAAAIEERRTAAGLMEAAVKAAGAFHAGARLTTLLFYGALWVAHQAVVGALGRKLAGEGLGAEARDGLEADLQALAVPFENDAERLRTGRLRTGREEARLAGEVADLEQQAEEELAYLSLLQAERRGEELPPEALLRAGRLENGALEAPAPAKRTRKR
jgi:hypothetical protein